MADDQVFEVGVRDGWMGLDEFLYCHWIDIMFQLFFAQLPDEIIVFRARGWGHMVQFFLKCWKMGQVVLWKRCSARSKR